MTTTYQFPMFEKLEQCTPWSGGMLAGSDVVTLDDAARFASKHAGAEITPADFLRAAGRGQIPMRAICPRAATMEPCRETDQPLTMPENCMPTLPLEACKALSNTGRAKWRTIDALEKVETFGGVMGRFTRWQLPETEPDILTTPNDCRVMGWDVHSLADAFIDKPAPEQSPTTPAPVVAALVELDKAGPVPVATRAMADSFAGLHWDGEQWIKRLGDKPVWLDACMVLNRGRGEGPRLWNPVLIGAYLVRMRHAKTNSVRARFQTQPALIPWLDEWKTYEADNHPTD